MQSLLDDRWQLIRTAGVHAVELYDYRADPVQARNLAGDSAFDAVTVRLRRELSRLVSLGPNATMRDVSTTAH